MRPNVKHSYIYIHCSVCSAVVADGQRALSDGLGYEQHTGAWCEANGGLSIHVQCLLKGEKMKYYLRNCYSSIDRCKIIVKYLSAHVNILNSKNIREHTDEGFI